MLSLLGSLALMVGKSLNLADVVHLFLRGISGSLLVSMLIRKHS